MVTCGKVRVKRGNQGARASGKGRKRERREKLRKKESEG